MEGEDEEPPTMDTSLPHTEDGIIIGAMGAGDSMGYTIDQDAAMTAGESEGNEGLNSVDLLATAVNLVSQAQMSKGTVYIPVAIYYGFNSGINKNIVINMSCKRNYYISCF